MPITNTAESASSMEPSSTFLHSRGAELARNWWAVVLRGVLAILFGLVALIMPTVTMLSLVIVFSAYLLVDGVLAITAAVREAHRGNRWGLLTLEGILDLVTAAVAFLWPGLTVLAFVLLVAIWAIVTGAVMVAAAFHIHPVHGRVWLVLGGLVSVIYGGLLIAAPLIGAVVLTWWIGAYALIFGVVLIIWGFKLRFRHHEDAHPTGMAQPAARGP